MGFVEMTSVPAQAADGLHQRATLTRTTPVDVFPESSTHSTATTYIRPLPFPERSALRFRLRSPVISQSAAVPSLLETAVTLARATRQLSVAETRNLTGCILWFGGQSEAGVALILWITGASQSRTTTRNRTGVGDRAWSQRCCHIQNHVGADRKE